MTPGPAALRGLLERCGFRLDPAAIEALWAYHRMLRAANAELNLTRIHNFENMVLKHYADSLLPTRFERLPSPLLDMGSGPGLPGIPLKIAFPEVEMILAEPRGARAAFLSRVVDALGLRGIEVYDGRITPRYDRKVAGVITRAVASIPETLDRVVHCLPPGGRALFMKGPDCDEEIRVARGTRSDRFAMVADHAYAIPGTPHRRRLVVWERLEEPSSVSAGAGAGAGGASSVSVSVSGARREHGGPVRVATVATSGLFRETRELLTGRGARKAGLALVSGLRFVSEILRDRPEVAEAWITPRDGDPPPEGFDALPWLKFEGPLFEELDVFGTRAPLLRIRVPEIPRWSDEDPWPAGPTLFLPFQDPENVGAAIRSAAAFGAPRVVLAREAAHPFHPKALRASGPSVLRVPLASGPSIREFAPRSVPLLALDAGGEPLPSIDWPERCALAVGLEGPGLPEELASRARRVAAPIAPGVESLNAAAAAAVALYDWRRRRPGPDFGFSERNGTGS